MRLRQISTASSWAALVIGGGVVVISARLPSQTSACQKRLKDRIAAAQVPIQIQHVGAATSAEQSLAEALPVCAGEAAIFFEPLHGAGVKALRANQGVVAGVITADRK